MAWENLAEPIRNRVEKFKTVNGSINISKLEQLTETYFHELKSLEYFEHEFYGIDPLTLKG